MGQQQSRVVVERKSFTDKTRTISGQTNDDQQAFYLLLRPKKGGSGGAIYMFACTAQVQCKQTSLIISLLKTWAGFIVHGPQLDLIKCYYVLCSIIFGQYANHASFILVIQPP
jgi:hypothetical protein